MTVERPREKGHGDYATNVAMQLAKKAGTNPRALGELLATALRDTDGITAVEVAGPGFLNITIEAGAQGQVAADIVAAGAAYGGKQAARRAQHQRRVRLRQPHRAAPPRRHALGSGGRRARRASSSSSGASVTREYYFNDHGAQIDRFARSLLAERPRGGPAGGRVRRRVHRRDHRPA